ncbi:MAG: hypothetical protein BRC32_02615 [Actinobacteria bacterium QS_8_72_14]|nr:MAG: hypothetical protein BRC32_02615 [Actinobacteria bacterium QS_8_72_14]
MSLERTVSSTSSDSARPGTCCSSGSLGPSRAYTVSLSHTNQIACARVVCGVRWRPLSTPRKSCTPVRRSPRPGTVTHRMSPFFKAAAKVCWRKVGRLPPRPASMNTGTEPACCPSMKKWAGCSPLSAKITSWR